MADAVGEREREREKEMWRRFAFLAAEVVNISGKSVRRPIKAKDLVRFEGEEKPGAAMTKEQIEQRKREAMETAKLHKSKFWEKLKDESVRNLTGD